MIIGQPLQRVIVLCAALAGTLSALAVETKTQLPTDEHRRMLDRFRLEYPRNVMTSDVEQTLSLASDDLRLMPAYQWTVLGKLNATAYYRALGERFEVRDFRRTLGELTDLGTRIVEYGTFTQKLLRRDTRKEYELAGKYLDLWTKLPDGSVRLVTQVWNYDKPLDFGDELRFPSVSAVRMALGPHVPVKGGISFDLAALNALLGVAIAQHDAAVWEQFFADDAVMLTNYVPIRRGRREIEEYLVAHTAQLPVFEHLDIRNDQIDDLGSYVIEYASHVANWRSGDSSGVSTGKNLRIWRREPGGGLRLFWQIGNYD
jgi:ketosteroid isomerase-like protein